MQQCICKSLIDSIVVNDCRMRLLDAGGKTLASFLLQTLTMVEDTNSVFFDDGRSVVTFTNAELAGFSVNTAALLLASGNCTVSSGGGGGGGAELFVVEYALDESTNGDITNEYAVIVTPGLIADGSEVVIAFRGIVMNTEDYNSFTPATGVLDWAAPTGMADLIPAVDDIVQIWWVA